jgi:hypothetical protein
MAIKSFAFLFIYLLSVALASPLVKRVTLNYEWDLDHPEQYSSDAQTSAENQFREEMQGVYRMARIARDFIGELGQGSETTTFGYYFGRAITEQDVTQLRSNFERVADLQDGSRQLTIRFTDHDSIMHPGAQAWTSRSGTININLPRFNRITRHNTWVPYPWEVSIPQLDHTPSRSVLLLHELFHVRDIGRRIDSRGRIVPLADYPYPPGYQESGTGASVYGQTAANRLVRARHMGFRHAIQNADNLALFAFSKYLEFTYRESSTKRFAGLWANQYNQRQIPEQRYLPHAGPPNGGNWNQSGIRDMFPTPPRGTATWWLNFGK